MQDEIQGLEEHIQNLKNGGEIIDQAKDVIFEKMLKRKHWFGTQCRLIITSSKHLYVRILVGYPALDLGFLSPQLDVTISCEESNPP